MKRNRFDPRGLEEILGNLITERTDVGDSIKLLVKFNHSSKPNIWLEFQTYVEEKKQFDPREELTDWVEDKPYFDIIDDSTGKPIPGGERRGSLTWNDYIEKLGWNIQQIIKASGRIFSYEKVESMDGR
jgi:hypothetical protein